MPLRRWLWPVAAMTMVGCMGDGNRNDGDRHQAMNAMVAVEQGDPAAAREAAVARRGLEQRDESGATPFLKAIATGQYVIAEILADHGADPWAADEFGLTAMHYIRTNPFPPGTAEGDAKVRVRDKLRAIGFPDPPPPQGDVRHLIETRRWPPQRRSH
ncbi:hypothetical protein [Sphingomonas sp.]|uniref:hypothetical protein n=1 Tax=Sphingomonas sp. TaxID=28214 RepID=UPI003CC53845